MASNVTTLRTRADASARVAAEVRAEIARQGLSQRQVTARLHVSQPWLSRRIGSNADVALTLEDVEHMAKALEVPLERLASVWFTPIPLPRLDSNQQPSGSTSSQVSAVVIPFRRAS